MDNVLRNRRAGILAVTVATATAMLIAGPASAAKPPSGGAWSAGVAISAVEQPDPTRGSQGNDVAVNANGTALAAWDRFSYAGTGGSTIGAAVQTGGRWGAPFTVSGSTGFSSRPSVAVASDGALAVSWTYQDPIAQTSPQQKIQVAVRAAGSTTWQIATLASSTIGGTQGLALSVPVAFDAVGNLTAAWTLWNGSLHRVQAATLTKGGTWSAAADLAPGFDGLYPALAVDAAGDAGVVVSTSPYAAGGSTEVKYVFRQGATGAWAPAITVSEVMSSSIGYISSPLVALDSSGLATVVYMGRGLEATRQATGSWTTPATIISSPVNGASFMSPDLALDSSGNAVAIVAIFDPTIGVDRSSVWVSRGTPAGVWGTAARLTDPTVPVDAYATRAAVSPDGGLALVAWIDHYHGTVQAARLDKASGRWVTASVGKGTAFSSFQETLALDAASTTVARVIWKNARTGTQTFASDYRP